MKVVLLGDVHMGARKGDLDFAEYFNRFFSDVLYPYMKENDIKEIIQVGDFFDDQKVLDYDAWKACKPKWINPIIENGWRMHVLVGNHDITYKNTLRVNSPDLILADFSPHINIIEKPTTVDIGGYVFDLVPWICKDNYDESIEFIKKQKGSVLLGHFSIEGFPMYKGGQIEKKGLPQSLFETYPFVYSGHFHTRSEHKNITYLGTPYEITWSDYDDPKGFHVFDTKTQQCEFVVNPYTMFTKFKYSEGMATPEDLEGKFVRCIVTDRGDLKKYSSFIEKLKAIPTKELDIVEQVIDTTNLSEVNVDDIDWINDTPAYIRKTVDTIETDVNKEDLSDYLIGLYNRAITL